MAGVPDAVNPDDTTEYRLTGEPPPEPGPRFPWPPAEGEPVTQAFVDTWTGASLRPRSFFSRMPEHGTIRTTLLYYIPLGIAVAGVNLFWRLVLGGFEEQQEAVLGEMQLGDGMNPLVEFFMSPVILLLSLFIAAGITHALLKLFGGASRSFGFTTRVFAYAYSPQILTVVPVVGNVVGFVWMVGIAIIGLKEGHRTGMGRVLAAVLIPVIIGLMLMAVALFIARTGNILSH
jgi:hypothetical protein